MFYALLLIVWLVGFLVLVMGEEQTTFRRRMGCFFWPIILPIAFMIGDGSDD